MNAFVRHTAATGPTWKTSAKLAIAVPCPFGPKGVHFIHLCVGQSATLKGLVSDCTDEEALESVKRLDPLGGGQTCFRTAEMIRQLVNRKGDSYRIRKLLREQLPNYSTILENLRAHKVDIPVHVEAGSRDVYHRPILTVAPYADPLKGASSLFETLASRRICEGMGIPFLNRKATRPFVIGVPKSFRVMAGNRQIAARVNGVWQINEADNAPFLDLGVYGNTCHVCNFEATHSHRASAKHDLAVARRIRQGLSLFPKWVQK